MNNLKKVVNDPKRTIVDVRSPMEFEEEHIEGAFNIPVDQVASHIGEFENMSKPIVLYCRSGARSGMALSVLQQHGITDAYNAGGLADIRYLIA